MTDELNPMPGTRKRVISEEEYWQMRNTITSLVQQNAHMHKWLQLIAESAPSDDADPHPAWADAALKGYDLDDPDIPWATSPLPHKEGNIMVFKAEAPTAGPKTGGKDVETH